MSQQRQFKMVVGSNPGGDYSDKTFTKIFVGGLAWETQRNTMRRYFEQFGEIIEAVVITDKNTGRSKGYGFVTFKDPESAMRACQNPSPVIDGRRANCNLASLGAQKTRSSFNSQHGPGRIRPAPAGLVAPPAFHGSLSTLVHHHHQPSGQYTFPYSAYGYSGYTQDNLYPLNYYNVYGDQQFSPYHTAGTSGAGPGMFHNFYPIYAQYAQTSQAHGFGVQYHPQMLQYPYLPQHYDSSTRILSLPSLAMTTTSTGSTTTSTTISTTITPPTLTTTGLIGAGAATTSQHSSSGTASEQNSSTK